MATRQDFETIIDLATRALNAGNDLGVLEQPKDDGGGAVAAAVDVAAELKDATLGGVKESLAVRAYINENVDLGVELNQEQLDQQRKKFTVMVSELQATAAGIKV